jgi:DNA mismatch repair ATPase MutS
MNRAVTRAGKRMMKDWIVRPLADAQAINARLDAVEELMALGPEVTDIMRQLKKLPDLERMISRVCQQYQT